MINTLPPLEPICGIILDYNPYIMANLILSLIIYVGYVIIRNKFRDKQEKLLYYLFLIAALQFSLNILLFIINFSPDHGIIAYTHPNI